ncbi:MAG: hypothetical protein HY961_04975 [Ignavibacteriae bacterium]|nr:hypothetical protein [Ignavibacteriota bacterium]
MDRSAEKLLKDIRKYAKAEAAYERSRLRLVEKEARSLGQTEASVQKELKAFGVDVKSLLKETAVEERELQKVHKRLMALVLPPLFPGDLVLELPRDPNVFDVKPPAIDGFGRRGFSDADCGFNLPLGETNLFVSRKGSGWGIQATAGQPGVSTLVFQFTPPRAGNVLVDVFVDLKGQFSLSAHDHWYTSTRADIDLKVSSRLFQHYWEFGPSSVIINEHRTDSSNAARIDRMERLSYSSSFSANDTVLFFVEVELNVNAHSSHARADVDFKTGAERRIKVPLIRVRYF